MNRSQRELEGTYRVYKEKLRSLLEEVASVKRALNRMAVDMKNKPEFPDEDHPTVKKRPS